MLTDFGSVHAKHVSVSNHPRTSLPQVVPTLLVGDHAPRKLNGPRGYQGTRRYLSPEVLLQENYSSPPRDIWAWGCTCLVVRNVLTKDRYVPSSQRATLLPRF